MKKQLLFLLSLWFISAGLWAQTNMPATDGGQTTVAVTSDVMFYDAGGETGNIPTYQITGITFTPRAGEAIEISFETIDLQGAALIKIFDGAKTLNSYYDELDDETTYTIPAGHRVALSGTKANETVTSVSADGKLTVFFQNANGTGAGWRAVVKSIPAAALPSDEVRIATTPAAKEVGDTPLNFYDDGGKTGKITRNFDGKITFTPTEAGKRIKIDFTKVAVFYNSSAVSVGNQDVLNIYNGAEATPANLLETLTTEPKIIKSTAADGSLTVTLKSKTGIPADGFEATVTQFTPAQMTFNAVELTQITTPTVCAGDKDQPVLSVNVKTADDLNPLTASKFSFNTNGTFANIEKATLYYTSKTNSFSTARKAGETAVTADAFEITCTEPQALIEGGNYFWLAYDLKTSAANGQTVDAGCTAVTVAGEEKNVSAPQPDGSRTIKNEYVSTTANVEKTVSGAWTYTHTPASAYSSNYKAETGDQAVTFMPASAGKIMEIDFQDFDIYYASSSYGTKAKFQIFSGKGTAGEKLWELADAADKNVGPARKIRSKASDGALTVVFNANTATSSYTAKGWHATVSEYLSQQMTLKTATAFQTNANVLKPNDINQEIIGIEIETEGDLTPVALQKTAINLKGSQSAVTKVSVFATGASKTFATTTLAGEMETPAATAEITLNTPLTLVEGKNYLWIAYNIAATAAPETVADAELISVTANDAATAATNGDPAGKRIVKNIYLFENGDNTVNVTTPVMFYDNGGAETNYTAAAKGTVRFVPKAGDVIKLVFKSFATNTMDDFFVYKGNSTAAADQLAKLYGTKTGLPDILSSADDGSLTIKFAPTRTAAGWEIEVQSYTPQPLAVASVKAAAVSADKLMKGAANEPMLKVAVEITGDKGTFNFNQLSFNADDAGKAAIAAAKLYYSANTDTFGGEEYGAETAVSPFVFSANTAITKPGTYYFWLACNVAADAAVNTAVTAALDNITEAVQGNIAITENTAASRTVQAGFSGTYTVGTPAADYPALTAAIQAMSGGIDGKVIFNIENGTYNELVSVPHIPGASAENTITIQSKNKNYNDVIFEVNTYSAPPYGEEKNGLFTVKGADYLTVEGISFKTTQAKFPAVVLVKKVSGHVMLKNCLVQAPRSTSYSAGDVALVKTEAENVPYANSDFLTVENCTLNGGYTGIYINGTGYVALPKQKGAKITGNTLLNQGSMSVYLTKEQDGIVENNTITINGSTASTFKAIDAVMMGNTIIRNNKIAADATTTGSVNAVYLRRRDNNETLAGHNRIYNNVIIIDNSKGSSAYGIYCSDPVTNTDVVYNSINISKLTAMQTSAPFYMSGSATQPTENITVENNIFQNNAGGYTYYINNPSSLSGMQFANNALYTSGTNFAYSGAVKAAFDDWKTASNEENSVVEQAKFISTLNLDLKTAGNLRAAKPLDFVTADINGTVRNAASPTMGAYEYAEIAMPEMSAGYPKIENVTHNAAAARVKLTENGKVYMLVKKATETAPAQAEILAVTAKDAAKNTELALDVTGLDAQTDYKLYYVLQSMTDENSDVIASDLFTTIYEPTLVSTFENITAASGDFTDGTARFNGFKVVTVTDGQGAGNKKAAQLQNNGTIAITNNANGLVLNGFYFKSDADVTLVAHNGTEEKGTKILAATGGKWVFINLKDMPEITSVSLLSAGNTLIDNFSGTPQPITFMLEDKTANQGETVLIPSDIYGGVLPYTYAWTNAKNETVSTKAELSFTAQNTGVFTLTVTDAWGSSAKWKSVVTVLGTAGVATFDDLHLAPETRWWGNPDEMTSLFYSGSYSFTNMLMESLSTWGGFAYSNKTSTAFSSFLTDQFNSSAGKGVNNSENYAVVYTLGAQTKVSVTNNPAGEVVSGFYITNNAWVKDVSVNGTGMASTDDPTGKVPFKQGDWYKITAKADNGKTLDFYLADYRDANAANHYTLTSWQWFDIRALGVVKSVTFKADGTRRNAHGSTIPFYFCMDDFGGTRKINAATKQTLKTGETKSIALADLFDTSATIADITYQITDNVSSTLGAAVIENGTLKLTAATEGESEVIVQKTVKGESAFVRIPVSFIVATAMDNVAGNTESITVMPNPAAHYITLNAGGKVEIYTANGVKAAENTRYTAGEQINVSHLANGVYFVKINNQTVKLIKK